MDKSTNKYYTISTYVDTETGEIISKSIADRRYIKIKKTTRFENRTVNNINYNGKEITYECRVNGQTELFD